MKSGTLTTVADEPKQVQAHYIQQFMMAIMGTDAAGYNDNVAFEHNIQDDFLWVSRHA